MVDTVYFKTGKDAALASGVYLKHGEEVLHQAANAVGKDFDSIPLQTRLCLLRLAFNAGQGRAKKNLLEYLQKAIPVLILRPVAKAGPQRKATWRTAQAIHLAEVFFNKPLNVVLNETNNTETAWNDEVVMEKVSIEDLVTVNTPTCTIDPAKKNAIGFEFDMLLNITQDLKKTKTILDKTLISTHTEATDGFVLKIDGNKIEVSTKPFELSPAGLTDLKNTFTQIENWISEVKKSLRTQKKTVSITKDPSCPSCISGNGIYLETATSGNILKIAPAFITPNHFIFPLKTAISIIDNYYTSTTDIRGVPQATMGVPLASINKLVDIIRSKQGGSVGEGLTGSSGRRLGLRSDALFNAQFRVNIARKFFLTQGSFGSLKITRDNFTDTLTGFMILMVEYFWTSVLPLDPRDRKETFSKAYVPLHSKIRFREMFHCLLNDAERELFVKVFWENNNWKNLYSLTKKINGKKGGYTDITTTPSIRLFPTRIAVTKPTWHEFVTSIVENNFNTEQPTGNNTLVTGPTKAIPLTAEGAIVEFRRMGFGTISSTGWRNMALRLFSIAQKMNDIDKTVRETEYEDSESQGENLEELDRSESYELTDEVDQYDESEDESLQYEETPEDETEENFLDEISFEEFVPVTSLPDVRQRIDEYFDLAFSEYTQENHVKIKARSQFRYAWKGQDLVPGKASEKIKKQLRKTEAGKYFVAHNSTSIHYAVYGRPKPYQIRMITQALIDSGALADLRIVEPTLFDEQLIRKLQRNFGVGIDCAGYVQLAFIYAYTGTDADTPGIRTKLGLKVKRGDENLGSLSARHFKNLGVLDARTGDLLILNARAGDTDHSGHTVIIVDHVINGNIHSFVTDASWGTDMYGENAGGIGRRILFFNTSTNEWWDKNPVDGSDAHRNTIGPYAGHSIRGIYRPLPKAISHHELEELENLEQSEQFDFEENYFEANEVDNNEQEYQEVEEQQNNEEYNSEEKTYIIESNSEADEELYLESAYIEDTFAETETGWWSKHRLLNIGDKGEDVGRAQKTLEKNWGIPVKVTKVYDDNTVAAVKKFQQMQGLEEDGKMGPFTHAALFESNYRYTIQKPKIIKQALDTCWAASIESAAPSWKGRTPATISSLLSKYKSLLKTNNSIDGVGLAKVLKDFNVVNIIGPAKEFRIEIVKRELLATGSHLLFMYMMPGATLSHWQVIYGFGVRKGVPYLLTMDPLSGSYEEMDFHRLQKVAQTLAIAWPN